MCGRARSTATPARITSIINRVLAQYGGNRNIIETCNNVQSDTNLNANVDSICNLPIDINDHIVPGMSMFVAYLGYSNELIIEEMKWGLYGFAGKPGITFNSRLENIGSNYLAKTMNSNRAIIIIDGYYEKKIKIMNITLQMKIIVS